MDYLEFQEEVYDYLEYIGYPQLVEDFEPEGVAKSLHNSIMIFYVMQVSHRLTALSIFGMTWDKLKHNINVHGLPTVH